MSWVLILGTGLERMITYQPVLLVSFFSFSGELWGAGGGESKDSLFPDGSVISFGGELAAEEKVSRSLWTSFGTSTVMRELLIALRLKMFPKLPIMLLSQYLLFNIGRSIVTHGRGSALKRCLTIRSAVGKERVARKRRTGYYKRNLLCKDSGSSLLSRRSASKVKATYKNVVFSCNVSESWIIVLKTDLCHSLSSHIVLISVLSRIVSASRSVASGQVLLLDWTLSCLELLL